jgi:hypothetical protein
MRYARPACQSDALLRLAAWPRRIATAALAISASLVITAAYHLGFPEFRGPELIGPLIGNGVFAVYAKAKSLSSMVTTPFSRTLSPR